MLPTEDLFERFASDYDGWFESLQGQPLFESELRCVQALLSDEPRPWLEIGVGTGRFARALGVEMGVDPATKALELAAAREVTVLPARGEALPFADGQFGVVLCIVTLCFAPEPLGLLKEAARVVRPDGQVVLGLVLADSPWGRHYVRLGENGHRFYSRARLYTLEEVRGLVADAGLTFGQTACTLFQPPEATSFTVEEPREGLDPAAGFVAIGLRRADAV